MAVESEIPTRSEQAGTFERLASFVTGIDTKKILIAYTIGIAIYVYLPIFSLIAFSFNAGGLTFPFVEFSTVWYSELLANAGLVEATINSLKLAFVTMIVTTILATMVALAYRYDFFGKRAVLFVVVLGIIVPGIAYGIGARLFLVEVLSLPQSLWLATTVHVVWTLPFALIVLLAGFPPNLAQNERAARLMGADSLTVFKEITFPQIAPTVLGAAVFAFTLSYNEAERGLLLMGHDSTMPIEIYSVAAAERATPEMFALGSITSVLSFVLLLAAGLLVIYGSRHR